MQGRLIAAFVLISSSVFGQASPPPAPTSATPAAVPPATSSAAPPSSVAPAPASAPAPTPPPAAAPAPPPPGYPPYGYQYPYPPPQQYPYPYAYPPPATPPPPATLPYNEGEPVPPGYHVESRVRRGPIVAGTIMAGSTYLVNLLAADFEEESGDDRATWLYVPGVGTWAYVDGACDNERDGCSFLIMHSLTHSIGLALILYGIAAPKQILARDTATLRVTPYLARSTSGISASGSF